MLGPKTSTARAARPKPATVLLDPAVRATLGAVQTLPEFLGAVSDLSAGDRLTIVEQALVMIDQTYVHLPLKRAMHAIEPVQRLRLLQQRLAGYSERAFHNEMISIFVHLRDLHTNYILPDPFRSRTAFLPISIEECFVPGIGSGDPQIRYLITRIAGTPTDPSLKRGAIVTHWNGIPIDTAVEINADREAGSNRDARHLRGLESMTQRWMGMSLPPDEEWVTLRYLPASGTGAARDALFEWQVFMPEPAAAGGGGSVPGADRPAAGDPHLRRIGIDAKAEMLRRVRKLLFAPAAVAAERKMVELGASAPDAARAFHTQVAAAAAASAGSFAPERGAGRAPSAAAGRSASRGGRRPAPGSGAEAAAVAAGAMIEGIDLAANSIMPDVFKEFGKVTTPQGSFGYIRIVTFAIAGGDIDGFLREFIRIAALLPQDGLIIDVRGNGGGTIAAGEGLLQTMTPVTIEPERFHLINTPLTLRMCEQAGSDLADWAQSVAEAVETGTTFSKGLPLTPPDFCNEIGQTYQGPVLLIVDAGCYSTTDMFAAGFQDHAIGDILGTSGHTGAGGANVWEHGDLEQTLPGETSPFRPIPGDASFRVAIRRSSRIGIRAGEPIEDLGVVPDLPVYQMTPNDILNGNADLVAHACGILAAKPRQSLRASGQAAADGSIELTVTTANLQRVDVWRDGRPLRTLDVGDGATPIAAIPAGAGTIEIRGYRDGRCVASTRLTV